jgi:asparagine synthase (glutamine-hydrolysing)
VVDSVAHYIERVVDLTDPEANQIYNMTLDDARRVLLDQPAEAVQEIEGSFALLARSGKTVKMARSLDRPMRYFLAKRSEGPALVVSSRIDAIFDWLKSEGLDGQFHPSYTRMVPAHHVVELQLIGCPDPDPVYTRFFTPAMGTLPPDLDTIGRTYISALADEISRWLRTIPQTEPIGVCFSGGIDSGSVFLTAYYALRKLGMNPARLKAFVLDLGDGPDVDQAHTFLDRHPVRHHGHGPLPRYPRTLPRLALPHRRRWRRREPQRLPHRRKSRAHHPQRYQ